MRGCVGKSNLNVPEKPGLQFLIGSCFRSHGIALGEVIDGGSGCAFISFPAH
ncbi:hypothetical protein [Syntrophomonas erecta]